MELSLPTEYREYRCSCVSLLRTTLCLFYTDTHIIETVQDKCKHLIEDISTNWTPERHHLFSPVDRAAIFEILRVGKRLEQQGRGIYLDLWPNILAFVGRGWFEIDDVPSRKLKLPALVINMDAVNEEEHMEDDDMQFELEEHIAIL